MYLVDYHTHSKHSFDGECKLKDMCETAISRGISELAITDHMDIFSDKPYEYIMGCKEWYKELTDIKEEYKGRLKVIRGIELGQPQANESAAKEFLNDYELDFVIGSIHNMEHDKDAYDYNYNETDYHIVFDSYMKWQLRLAGEYDYDVLAHVTYPARYVYEQTKVLIDYDEYLDQYEELFKIVIQRGKGIELNLSGIARNIGETMPSVKLLKMYKSLGGEIITVGSDAHKLEHIGIVSKYGYEMLSDMGFSYVATYENRKLKFIPIK